MKTFPIDFPAAEAPATPVARCARTLGIHPYAVALATLGWPTVCRCYHRERSRGAALEHVWFVGSHPANREQSLDAASRLIDLLPVSGEKALPVDHPIHAAVAALANMAALMRWAQTGGPVPGVAERGAFLVIDDTPSVFPAAEAVAIGVTDLAFLAAAITVGFVPFAELVAGQDGKPAVGFPAASRLRPELLATDLASVIGEPGLALRTLPGHPPEEHPFFYALQACRNVAPMLQRQSDASKNPVREIQNPWVLQYRTLVSNSLLEGTGETSRRVKAAVHQHMKKTA